MRVRRRVPLAAMLLPVPLGTALLAFLAAGGETSDKPKASDTAARFMYLPPEIADNVVFYHSFENGVAYPEINLIGARVTGGKAVPGAGFTGSGHQALDAGEHTSLRVESPALAPNRPLTIALWWRLDQPMKPETCFELIALRGKGYISNFVRGRGPWCALREPTYVFQVQEFPDITNSNQPHGKATFEPGEWHHTALTISNASEIKVYWDGKLRTAYGVKGRLLRDDDISLAELGGPGHPITIDDVLVLDCALNAAQIESYVAAVKQLADMRFPFTIHTGKSKE